MRISMKPVAAALIALPLAACISFGPKAPPFLMALTPAETVPNDTVRKAGPGEAITVYTPSVPQALLTTRVPVTSGANSVTYLKDGQWVEAPNRLFQQLLANTIAARTGKVVLNPRQSTIDPGVRLTGDLEHFGLDAQAMKVIVTYDAIKQSRGGEGIETRRFEATAPVSAAEPRQVAAALNLAANQVATQVSDWLR